MGGEERYRRVYTWLHWALSNIFGLTIAVVTFVSAQSTSNWEETKLGLSCGWIVIVVLNAIVTAVPLMRRGRWINGYAELDAAERQLKRLAASYIACFMVALAFPVLAPPGDGGLFGFLVLASIGGSGIGYSGAIACALTVAARYVCPTKNVL